MYIYLVIFCDLESDVVKALDSRIKAEQYIESMYTMPQEDSEGYANDDYLPPENLHIQEIELE
jgi:hypothetical protein